VHQVRRGMRAGNGPAALDVDLHPHRGTDGDLARRDPAPMHDQAGNRRLDITDLDQRAVACSAAGAADHRGVGKLAAALGIARCPVEHHVHVGPGTGRLHGRTAGQQPDHRRVGDDLVIAGEHDLSGPLKELGEDRDVGVTGLLGGGVIPGSLPLLSHQPPEFRLVHVESLLGRHLQGQVDRESVGVVQLEGLCAGDHRGTAPGRFASRRLEDRRTGAQRGTERGLLGVQHGVNVGRVPDQLGILISERADRDRS
jgi:hypothetical protein